MTTRALLALSLGLVLAGCSGESGSPLAASGPGALQVVIDAADDSTGSMLLTLAGGRVDSLVPGDAVYGTGTLMRSGATLFVTGTMTRGDVVATVWVPDLAAASRYTASVDEAASASDAQRAAGSVRVRLAPVTP